MVLLLYRHLNGKRIKTRMRESFDSRYCVLNLIFFVIILHTKTEVWKVKYESSFRLHPECHFTLLNKVNCK